MMIELRKTCEGCIWNGSCPCSEACDDYTPIDEYDDTEIQLMIEMRRDEYRRAYADYVSQY